MLNTYIFLPEYFSIYWFDCRQCAKRCYFLDFLAMSLSLTSSLTITMTFTLFLPISHIDGSQNNKNAYFLTFPFILPLSWTFFFSLFLLSSSLTLTLAKKWGPPKFPCFFLLRPSYFRKTEQLSSNFHASFREIRNNYF